MFIVEQIKEEKGELVHYHQSESPAGAYREFKRLTDEPDEGIITRIVDEDGEIISRPRRSIKCLKAEKQESRH